MVLAIPTARSGFHSEALACPNVDPFSAIQMYVLDTDPPVFALVADRCCNSATDAPDTMLVTMCFELQS
jgi:hypothetical protein